MLSPSIERKQKAPGRVVHPFPGGWESLAVLAVPPARCCELLTHSRLPPVAFLVAVPVFSLQRAVSGQSSAVQGAALQLTSAPPQKSFPLLWFS